MSRIINEPVPSTPNFDFLHGEFGMGEWRIPYFATTLTFEEAAQHLHLPSDIPGGENIRWSISELYQRNIDWRRVSRQIAPYLRAPDVPQFFNSITIALLPYNRGDSRIVESLDEGSWHPPELQSPEIYMKQLDIGPMRFGFWDSWTSYEDPGFVSGRMRWNTNEVFAVALDGQHRLAAIKEVVGPGYVSDVVKSRVPVLFLLFHPDVGFVAPGNPPIVEVLRKLFIDLNKHAKTVNRARQILLDDRDPCAISVHALLAPVLEGNVASLEENPPRLPLSLVDWFTEQAKFDSGPHITTVLGLDWAVAKVLETSPIVDMTAYNNVSVQLMKLESRLSISLQNAKQRLDEVKSVKLTPFSYSDDELEQVSNAFGKVWNRPLCSLFTQFKPYQELINQRIDNGTLSLDWQEWDRLREAQKDDPYEGKASIDYRRFLGVLIRREHPVTRERLEELLTSLELFKKDNLAFNVVFQRALLLGFLDYLKVPDSYISQLQDQYEIEDEEEPNFDVDIDEVYEDNQVALDLTEESELEEDASQGEQVSGDGAAQKAFVDQIWLRATEFIQNFNDLLSVFDDYLNLDVPVGESQDARMLWAGSLRKPEGVIDFTMGASSRARDLIFLTAAMSTFYRSTSDDVEFDDLWVELLDLAPTTSFVKRMRMALNRMTNTTKESSLAVRIIRARGGNVTTTAAQEEAKIRLRNLWERIAESVNGT